MRAQGAAPQLAVAEEKAKGGERAQLQPHRQSRLEICDICTKIHKDLQHSARGRVHKQPREVLHVKNKAGEESEKRKRQERMRGDGELEG